MVHHASRRSRLHTSRHSAVADAVKAVITSRADFITERGMAAVGPLMGMVMAELGGSADGALVIQILREKISEILKD